jgi:hypothetical protein
MKLNGKNILACAVGAGLLTFASGQAQAIVIDNELVIPLNAQLIIKYSVNGKAKRASITSKSLVTAIGEDFNENLSGDQIVFYYGDGDYHLMDKHNTLGEDLTEDGVIIAEYNQLSTSSNDGNNGKFKDVETGTVDFEFYSDGVTPADVADDEGTLDDNTLEFADTSVPYTFTETGGAFKNNNAQQVTITEKDSIGATGHDFDVVDLDDQIIFGMMTQNGSGKTTDTP